MKKLLFILSTIAVFAATAQTTTRFSATPSGNNTGSGLTYAVITTTDVTSATIDTITFQPNAWETIWRPSANLADSVVIKFSSTTTTYKVGDSFQVFLKKGTGAGRYRMGGSQYIVTFTNSTGVAIAANKSATIRFRWNGSKWMEVERTIEP